MTQTFTPTLDRKVAVALSSGVYHPKYAGAPNTKSGLLWAHEYPRKECWVEGTSIVNAAKINNLFAEVGAPDNAQILVNNAHSPLTYVDQGGGAASGFQINAIDNTNLLQLGGGTDFFQANLTNDFYVSVSDVYPDTTALDNGSYLLSKLSGSASTNPGLLISRVHGQTGGSAVRIDVKFSDNSSTADDYLNTNVAAAGVGKGFHCIAVTRIATVISVYYDGVLLGAGTAPLTTLSSNSTPLTRGGRNAAGLVNQIIGLKMISDMGVDLTLAAAALGTTSALLGAKLAAQEWAYLNAKYGSFT